ncbi:DUF7284 family protein [Halodesulfurarchaeum sp.]|uniref:DUF7284 family protein n=1 Tax=Halodesulfurarchaeum sp. TaxID=1980530 RepID=UPI001BC5F5EB|nr:hypothetical protein [Halodesulfurarchaeum sp.]
MTADRAISTPIDVVLGLLLVGIATGVVATAVPAPIETPSDGGQAAILGSSLTVEFESEGSNWTVHETVGGHLADAALAGDGANSSRKVAYRQATRAAITDHVETHGAPVQVIGVCRGTQEADPLLAGRTPPGDRPIRATVYELPQPIGINETECQPVVVLRRWSP